MTRIKSGTTRRRRHKKVLKQTRGHQGVRHTLYSRARESLIHALKYSYAHRRKKKGDMRRLWTIRINAAARINGISYSQLMHGPVNGISYSQLMHGLRLADVQVNRKVLADLALNDPEAFAQVASQSKASLMVAAA